MTCGFLTVSVTTDSKLDITRDLNLDHGGFIIYNLLDGKDDLVDVFSVNLLAGLESFHHVVNELLCHLLAKPYTIVSWLNSHRVQIETFSRGGFIADLDRIKESHLSNNLFALFQLESSILVAGVEGDTCLEVVNGILGS